MDAIDQQWYNVVDEDIAFDEGRYELFPQSRQSASTASSLGYCNNEELLADDFTVLELPPSLRAAAANIQFIPTYDTTARDSGVFGTAYRNDASDRAAASAPLSFHNRSLLMALPQMQYGVEELSHEVFLPDLSFARRADSAIGGYDEIPGWGGLEDSQVDTTGLDEGNEYAPQSDPLQYHLIQTKSRANFQESLTAPAPPHDRPETAPRSSTSNDNRTLSCYLCPDKHYTGVWAQRNLSRHIESAHAPSSSPDGVRQIRCSLEACDRTFRRDDARLVHERKSHPELNRAPPTKRKRSGEL